MEIRVKLKTGSSQEKVEKISENEYNVWVKSPPEKGQANRDLERVLKNYFKRSVELKKGFKSKNKVLVI